ncbi:hypothetical protein GH714_009494 [Hevea brasiliensis]|uniref:CN hydrolase domain-containing protein n=1 Tax=Hevea brasiliensis TaxID=3981 RepID=A0A6A6N1W0_HEVBR|nr:hypothetical protein GH714_009494 [Hevea brasiliensis]
MCKGSSSSWGKIALFTRKFLFIGAKDGDSVKVAEPLDGPIMQQYCSLARESGIWLSLGGFQEKGCDDEHLRNTHVIVDDSGSIRDTYRKIFLFDVDVPGGRVYKESSFTELGQGICIHIVGCLAGSIGTAAFTKITGQAHWEILLRARAIETQCYVIAAAQAGKHNDKRESHGETLIIDPWGTVVGRLPDRLSTGITVADIDLALIDSVRAKMPIAQVNYVHFT